MSATVTDISQPKPLVAVVQMTSVADKQTTLDQLTALVERAKFRGAQMVLLLYSSNEYTKPYMYRV